MTRLSYDTDQVSVGTSISFEAGDIAAYRSPITE